MRRTMLVAAAALALGGCAKNATAAGTPASDMSRVPVEFRAACGQPGAEVTVTKVPVTVRHADCDLSGAKITYGLASVGVPKPGEGVSTMVDTIAPTDKPTQVEVAVDKVTEDVTVTG